MQTLRCLLFAYAPFGNASISCADHLWQKRLVVIKWLIGLPLGLLCYGPATGQLVGIGTNTPAYPFTVVADANGVGVMQRGELPGGTVVMGFVTNLTTGAWLKTVTNHKLGLSVNHTTNNPDPALIIGTDNRVGLSTSTTTLTHVLTSYGRLRLRHNSTAGQTAGIWMDGPTLSTRSFIGTINDDHTGLWGSGGAGWNIAMNVINGNVGIGTSAPTARLDISGTLRLRGESPKIGSKLISEDVSGNATWQAPIAFRTSGTYDGDPITVTSTRGKYLGSPYTDYNLGLGYNTISGEFIAPVTGIYHFSGQLSFQSEWDGGTISIEVREPDGYPITNFKYSQVYGGSPYPAWNFGIFEQVVAADVLRIAVDIRMLAGEKATLHFDRYNINNPNSVSDAINPDPKATWFSGHLISRL